MKATLFALAFSCLFVVAARAASLEEVQQNMKDRKPAVTKILATANVGENNGGFLQKLKDISADEAKTLTDENADRKFVYAAIAQKTSSTESQVGRQRAEKIAESAPAGTMIQQADGTWKKK